MADLPLDHDPSVAEDVGFGAAPPMARLAEMDTLREEHPFYWVPDGEGYWVITRFDDIREAARDSVTFSNDSIIPTDPNPQYRLWPSFANPPELLRYRQPLNRWFSPTMVERWRPAIADSARELTAAVRDSGSCDFMSSFATAFTAEAFLVSVGLTDKAIVGFFISLVERFSQSQANASDEVDVSAFQDLAEYWSTEIATRRRAPLDPNLDFATYLLQQSVEGRPFDDDELISILVTVTLGSLDTVKAQLGWSLYHLAQHDDDRRRLTADPDVRSSAVEEILRAYPIVGMARKVTKDVTFKGCPMRKGEMMFLNYPSGCRDPRRFDDADQVVIDRTPNRHMAFGASEHRCIGSHLARAEMKIALEEWHRQIPDYALVDSQSLLAMGFQSSLTSLQLSWDPSTTQTSTSDA